MPLSEKLARFDPTGPSNKRTKDDASRRSTSGLLVHRKLQVGAAHDPAERDADRVADDVVRLLARPADIPNLDVQGAPPRIRRIHAAPSAAESFVAPPEVETRIERIRRSGDPLDPGVRSRFEGAMGVDLGAVRVHRNAAADELSRSVSAEAFTTGNDVFFSKGTYDPGSIGGQRLLAHELTHVVQQGGAVRRRATGDTRTEAELKKMTPEGGNPKSDKPDHINHPVEYEEEQGEEEAQEVEDQQPSSAESAKKKAMRATFARYRAGDDPVHRKKKARIAQRRSRIDKLKGRGKGRVAIAGSAVAKGAERAGNEGKHGVLNTGRSIGRLVGMDVNPNTSVRLQTGANTQATHTSPPPGYGACDTEFIEPTFTVKLVGTTWQPIVTRLKGTYGKLTSPLPPGLAEVTGPDPAESDQQIADLLDLDGSDWYMVRAVDAHESIHADHMHDALNNVGSAIANLFAGLTVDQSVAATEKDAIAAIKLLPGYDAIVNLADPNDSQMRDLWDAEYVNLIDQDHFGPTQTAEADIVEPMINRINTWRTKAKPKKKKIKKKWTCTNDNGALEVPKGRSNP